MKKVLMISYRFPPQGGVGSQRAAKFAKYLPCFGWQPIVLTVKHSDTVEFSNKSCQELASLPQDVKVYRTTHISPRLTYHYIRRLIAPFFKKGASNVVAGEETNLLIKTRRSSVIKEWLSVLIDIFFIPDRRIGWLPFATFKGYSIIKKYNIDVIYSVCSPPTGHLIAYILHALTDKPWIADYKDAWTLDPKFNKRTKWQRKLESQLEFLFIKAADKVICITEGMTESFIKHYKMINHDKFMTITHGYDPDDFINITPVENNKMTICYSCSSLITKSYTPDSFLNAISLLFDERPELRREINIVFIGHPSYVPDLLRKYNLVDSVTLIPYVEHRENIRYLMGADVLLVILSSVEWNKVKYTTKIFDYIGAGKFILGLVPLDGAAANLISSIRAGIAVDPDDIDGIKEAVYQCYRRYISGNLKSYADKSVLMRFNRNVLTEKLSQAFNSLAIKNGG